MAQEERTVCYDKDLEIEAYCFKGIMQKFPNHFHEHYVIGYIESGNRHLSCKNKDYNTGTGDLLLFNPMDNHTCEQIDNKPLDYRCINIKSEIMKKTVFEISRKNYLPVFSQTVVARSDLILLLKQLHMAIMEEQADFKKEETYLFLIEQLITEYTQDEMFVKTDLHEEIKKVCEYIDYHYTEKITLDELSRISDMNKYYLLRAFTKIRGITPYRYLETVRINESKKLLEKGVEPIEAALRTGFADQSHFTNNFKDYIGLTPKQYQNIFIFDDK